MAYAVIQAGKVVNIVEATPAFATEQGWPLVPAGFGVGDIYSNGKFSKPTTPAPTVTKRREALLQVLAQKRYEVETGGISAMGVTVRTDEVGQAKLTGAMALFSNDQTMASIDWEAQPGSWVTLDADSIGTIGVLVGRHVQACFSRARVVSEAITAANTHAALDSAEAQIDTGWPG